MSILMWSLLVEIQSKQVNANETSFELWLNKTHFDIILMMPEYTRGVLVANMERERDLWMR